MLKPEPLSASQISYQIDIDTLLGKLEHTSYINATLGQVRAEQAMEMGVEIDSVGYNILVIGPQGSGRRQAVHRVLEKHREIKQPLDDIVLVNNYQQPERPHVLTLPAGRAVQLRERLKLFIEDVQKMVSRQTQSESYKKQRDSMFQNLEDKERQRLNAFEASLAKDGFQVVHLDGEEKSEIPDLIPIYHEQITTFEELEEKLRNGEITEDTWQKMRGQYYHYMDEMKQIFSNLRAESREMERKIAQLSRSTVEPELEKLSLQMRSEFPYKKVEQYIQNTCLDILENLGEFIREEETLSEDALDMEERYGINILVNNQECEKRPIIFENNPTWANLFGVIEGKPEEANFMSIKAGSLLQASGGFLVMRLEDLLQEEDVWFHFKRVMMGSEVVVQSPPSPLMQTISLKPDPIKIRVKVLLTSSVTLYEHLYLQDQEFQKLFKILGEFEENMPRTDENCCRFLAFAQRVISEEKLQPLTKEGMVELLGYGIRMSRRRDRISCRLSYVADLLREANYWAMQMNLDKIDDVAVKKAENMRTYFHNLPQELIWREMKNQQLLIDVKGEAIGKVNALVVIERGFNTFGCPTLITAQVYAGKDSVINIEREVGLSGEIHDKGVFILEGFLHGRFARRTPLGISASLCFEQTYDGVEGDSATLAEICVLLSALGKIPLKQGIGITGSMNQMGIIQPVGGVNEKINGFFQVCQQNGLTGNQGVIFPESNLENIFPSEALKTAIEQKQFFLWPVRTVEEALMLLSDMEVGVPNKKGKYPSSSLFGRIEQELRILNS